MQIKDNFKNCLLILLEATVVNLCRECFLILATVTIDRALLLKVSSLFNFACFWLGQIIGVVKEKGNYLTCKIDFQFAL